MNLRREVIEYKIPKEIAKALLQKAKTEEREERFIKTAAEEFELQEKHLLDI